MSDLSLYLNYLKNISPSSPDIILLIQTVEQLLLGKSELETQKQTLQSYQAEFKTGKSQYDQGLEQLKIQKEELNKKKSLALSEFNKADKKIENAKNELEINEEKYNTELNSALSKITTAEKEIEDAKKDLSELEVEMYVLNIETNAGYVSYKSDLERLSAIGKIFPIIFFLVSALVSLTAMTRMVEENRIHIGTYKSLGYSKTMIAMKYIIYSTTATLLGIIIGILIGSSIFPQIISKAYSILYPFMPKLILEINIKYSLIGGLGAFLSTTLATMFSCYNELKTTPAYLMRPKAPKEGKKVFLEKITFIWKHFTFTQKITARNILRYKKRLLMTIIGIAGCTSLIFTGFGLRDSIASVVKIQYGEIKKYDFELTIKDNLNDSERSKLNSYIEKEKITDYIYLRQQLNDVTANGVTQNIYVVTPENLKGLNNFIKLQNRKTKENINIQSDGVVITEKLSSLLEIREGQEISIKINDNEKMNVKVTGIVENYIYNYIYMDKDFYQKTFKEEAYFNQIYLKTTPLTTEQEEIITTHLLENKNISQALLISSISGYFDDMIDSLNSVVIILIISATILAFIVLYNLNSINIEERKREIATIKLLGFYNTEAANYVFRENIILTIAGALVGLILRYLYVIICNFNSRN